MRIVLKPCCVEFLDSPRRATPRCPDHRSGVCREHSVAAEAEDQSPRLVSAVCEAVDVLWECLQVRFRERWYSGGAAEEWPPVRKPHYKFRKHQSSIQKRIAVLCQPEGIPSSRRNR